MIKSHGFTGKKIYRFESSFNLRPCQVGITPLLQDKKPAKRANRGATQIDNSDRPARPLAAPNRADGEAGENVG
jgi:hypothetical protein